MGQQETADVDEVFRVETHGIDPIPDAERHGSAKDLFWLWFGSNLTFTYVINGALAVAFGLSFWQATAVVVIGGLSFFAISAAGLSGIRTGTATLVISRAAFGIRGNFPAGCPQLGREHRLHHRQHRGGHPRPGSLLRRDRLAERHRGPRRRPPRHPRADLRRRHVGPRHRAVRRALDGLRPRPCGFGVLLLFVIPGTDTAAPAGAAPGLSGWSLAFVVMLVGPFSYLPMPADYTRYLPRTTSLKSLTWMGALGGFLSSVALGVAGVAAATQTDMTDAVAGAESLLPGWFQPLFLALVLGGSVTNSIITLYSSSLNLQVLGIPWSRARAIVISAAVTALGSLAALFLTDFTTSLLSFLSLLIIVFAPWGGVFLADMLLRRCHYDADALHAGSGGAYWYRSGYHSAGITALLTGMTFAALTCDSELWTGPLVAPLGGADLTLLGSVVSGLTYWALTRRRVAAYAPAA